MAHLHSENINGKNVIFYTDDTGIIWIRAFTLLQAVGLKAPGAALRSHINHRPGTGQKFNYPGHTTGDVEGKFTSDAWHFTYSEALEFLKSTRAAGTVKVRKGLEATVKALTAAYLAPPAITPVAARKRKAAPAKAKPAPANADLAARWQYMANTLTVQEAADIMATEAFQAAQQATAKLATPKDIAGGVKVGEAF